MAKPRSDSKLDNLDEQVAAELRDLFVKQNAGYKTAKKWLKEMHGVSTNDEALGKFYSTHCFALRFRDARSQADELRAVMKESPEAFDEATVTAVSQRAFELAVAKNADTRELTRLAKIIGDSAKLEIKRQELALANRRVSLTEKKAAAFDELKKATGEGGGISAEKLREIEKQLKLL
jgi:uncharacterized protein